MMTSGPHVLVAPVEGHQAEGEETKAKPKAGPTGREILAARIPDKAMQEGGAVENRVVRQTVEGGSAVEAYSLEAGRIR